MTDSRAYPSRPIVGVGGVVIAHGRVVLIRRRFEPLAGRWSIPGGTEEVGETLQEALVREVREETGLDVEAGPVLDVFDRITRDAEGRVRYHFVLVDYLCRLVPGSHDARWPRLAPASDVSEAVWADPSELARYALTDRTEAVIRMGVERLYSPITFTTTRLRRRPSNSA